MDPKRQITALFVGLGSIGTRHLKNLHNLCTDRGWTLQADALRSDLQRLLRDGVADMDVGSRRIDTEFDVEGFAALELLKQSAFRHDLRRARGDDVKLFFRCEHRNVLHTTDLHKRF